MFPTKFEDDKVLGPQIMKVAREETPAHLAAHVVWAPDFDAFRLAYEAWLTALREYWVTDPARLGSDILRSSG